MEVISLKSFLKLFHVTNEKPCTVKHLMTNAHVQIGTKRRKLREYKEDKRISTDTIKILCDNINNRDEYLTRFYNLSLQIYPDKLNISSTGVQPMQNRAMNNNQHIVFKNIIRNLHMFDILQHTKSGTINVDPYGDSQILHSH